MEPKQFTITKRIAKHGKQAVLIIPTLLQEHLEPGTLAEIIENRRKNQAHT
jgi:predicted RNA binding protein YcfA (HicA-like mRNA interferase family)